MPGGMTVLVSYSWCKVFNSYFRWIPEPAFRGYLLSDESIRASSTDFCCPRDKRESMLYQDGNGATLGERATLDKDRALLRPSTSNS